MILSIAEHQYLLSCEFFTITNLDRDKCLNFALINNFALSNNLMN